MDFNFKPLVKQLNKNVARELQASLNSVYKINELKPYAGQLNALCNQLVQVMNGVSMTRTNTELLRSLVTSNNNSSSVALHLSNNQTQDEFLINTLIQIMDLEHKILSILTNGMTDTTEYQIYYSIKDAEGNIKMYSTTIPYSELMSKATFQMAINSDAQFTSLQLQRADIINNFKQYSQEVSDKDLKTIADIAEKIIATMEAQLQYLDEIAHKQRLGSKQFKRWRELSALLRDDFALANTNSVAAFRTKSRFTKIDDSALLNLQNYYINFGNQMRRIAKLKNNRPTKEEYTIAASLNRGHMLETLYRMITNPDMDIYEALKQSVGNDIWWAKGDVSYTDASGNQRSAQVKAMIGDVTSVNFASLTSILQLAQQLQTILNSLDNQNSLNAIVIALDKAVDQMPEERSNTQLQKSVEYIAQNQIFNQIGK